jgi:hypothetical protein
MDLTDCVSIEQNGRSGRITVRIGGTVLHFEWEFGGGTVVAIIYVLSTDQWMSQDPWRDLNRDDTLDALGREVCRLKCRSCQYHFDDNFLELREHAGRS